MNSPSVALYGLLAVKPGDDPALDELITAIEQAAYEAGLMQGRGESEQLRGALEAAQAALDGVSRPWDQWQPASEGDA